MTYTGYYAVADFLGLGLVFDGCKISGKGKVRVDIGICKIALNVDVAYGQADSKHENLVLFLKSGLNLGVIVMVNLKMSWVRTILFDRTKTPNLTEHLSKTLPPDHKAIQLLVAHTKPKIFEGIMGANFKDVTNEV